MAKLPPPVAEGERAFQSQPGRAGRFASSVALVSSEILAATDRLKATSNEAGSPGYPLQNRKDDRSLSAMEMTSLGG